MRLRLVSKISTSNYPPVLKNTPIQPCCRCTCLVEEEMLNRLLSERCDKHEAGEEDKEIQTTTTMPEPLPAFYFYANI